MIHVIANNAQEIAATLRGETDAIRAKQVADRLLGVKHKSSGMVVTAPRQSGKTTELLKFAEQKNPGGQFIVVCLNRYMHSYICHVYRDLRGDPNVSPPLMVTPSNLEAIRGHHKPIYCDEWNLLSDSTRDYVLSTNLFVAAVTS